MAAIRPVRGLLFDLDGTLVHTDGIHTIVWSKLLKELGFRDELSEALYKEKISGRTNDAILKGCRPL